MRLKRLNGRFFQMTTCVSSCHTAWVKGAHMRSKPTLDISTEVGVVGDRRYAVARKPKAVKEGEWMPKGQFFVGMNCSQMPALQPYFDPRLQTEKGVPAIAPDFLGNLATFFGNQPFAVLNSKGKFNFCDTKGAFVSFLNLASVRALEELTGERIDPNRFRMNVWMEGLEPFEELNWVSGYPGTYEIKVGDVRFRVDDACERCQAIEANPDTGVYDLPLRKVLAELMQSHGYKGSPHRGKFEVMGILAQPLNSGKIVQGDSVRFL